MQRLHQHQAGSRPVASGSAAFHTPALVLPPAPLRGPHSNGWRHTQSEGGSSWVQRSQVSVCTMARDKTTHHSLQTKLDHLLQLTATETREADTSSASKASRPQRGKVALKPAPQQQRSSGRSQGGSAAEAEPIYKPVLQVPVPHTLPPLAETSSADAEEEYNPSNGWRPRPHHLTQAQLWQRIREEAEMDAAMEPALATFLHGVILSHNSMEGAMAFLLANKLADGMMLGPVQLMSLIREVYAADPTILAAGIADLQAVLDRDPACAKYSQCMLHFKGFQAIQAHRIIHYLWNQGRQTLALAIQARCSELFAVDIHPGAVLGRGVMFDHATGIVIGETAVVGDNVSLLHHVSLGGSGTGRRARHPHIGHGVLLGAGVAVLGPVLVGAGSKVGAGSVVVTDLPAHCVAVGVPARIVKRNLRSEPVKEMDQCTDFVYDYVI